MPECPPSPPEPAAPSIQFPLTRLLGLRAPPFSRSHHRTLGGIAGDGRLSWGGGGGSAGLSQERPLRFGAGEAAKRRDSGKGEKQQPERKQSCGVTQQEEGREEAERKRGRERERSFQGSSKSVSGASEGPRSVPHRRARAAHRPGAPREALLSGTTSKQVYGRRRKKLRSNPLPGQNG